MLKTAQSLFLSLALISFCSNLAAKLSAIDDSELAEVTGEQGIGFTLDNIQVLGDPSTTLEIDNGTDTSSPYIDHLRVYNFDSPNDGNTISAINGVSWGTPSDPFILDVNTPSVLQSDGSTSGTTQIEFLFPKGPVTTTDYVYNINDAAGPATGTRTIPQVITYSCVGSDNGDICTPVTLPYQCDGDIECLTLAFRSRWDIYTTVRTTDNSANPANCPATVPNCSLEDGRLGLFDRSIQWWQLDGLNLHGSSVSIWASDKGLSAKAEIIGYIDQIRSTRSTNTNTNTYTGSDTLFNNGVFNYLETTDTINKTAPFSDDDTPNFSDPSQLINITGVSLELYIGHLAYQPLTIGFGITPTESTAPSGGVVQSDVAELGLSINLAPITPATSDTFYEEAKGNIFIENIAIGADATGNCINPNQALCSFGNVSVQGLQIQSLDFQTRNLTPLTASHCPGANFTSNGAPAWTCSWQ